MTWKQVGALLGGIVAFLAIIGAVYKADCWNVEKTGEDHFVEIPTYLAGQQKVFDKFDAWELKDKQREISDMDNRYGPGCARCDAKLKQYYDMIKLERDRLLKEMKGK